jgi:hypothetical protein
MARARLDRRRFLSQAGVVGLGVAAAGLTLGSATPAARAQSAGQLADTPTQILTAFLIAEDLASTFYYNGLVGKVIQDPALAGPGGSANHVTSQGNAGNVNYLQAALTQEIDHATLMRDALQIKSAAGDPVQTFYFKEGTFDTLAAFTSTLNALENAFIGAYLNAVQELALMASNARINGNGGGSSPFTAEELEYFAKLAASILGVECEHRVLGRVISNSNPANNLPYEQTDGLTSVYNGPNSAVVALTPFLTESTGPAYSLATALANQRSVSIPVSGNPPAYPY